MTHPSSDTEQSFGVIPLRQQHGRWEVLMVCHRTFSNSYWSFPKGHAEADETPIATASRELLEETGLQVDQFLDFPPLQERYHYKRAGRDISKQVVYFLAKVSGQISLQIEEIVDAAWVPLSEAADRANYAESKALCHTVCNYLSLEEKGK